ncbi:MAG: DUF1116 domain-containing protein [Candidatus Hadarchaeales archaeon]
MPEKDFNSLIDEANISAVERIMESHPFLVGIDRAIRKIPGMKERMLLHAGYPRLSWEEMIGPMKGAVIGAILYEGWADSKEKAIRMAERGEIEFSPTVDHSSVAPMAGIISPSMPVFLVENRTYGNFAYSNINEGLGKALRFGAFDDEVIKRLRWIEEVLMPSLEIVLREMREIDLRGFIEGALHRGDECHNRNKTVSLMFLSSISSVLIRSDLDREKVAEVVDFINGNPHFFLNLSIPSSKCSLDAAHGINYSTVVSGLTTNGKNLAMRVSGLDNWITAPSVIAKAKYFRGFDESCAAPVLGDSYHSEPAGIGAFAMAAAPAIVSFVGGEPDMGFKATTEMYRITVAEHRYYKIANLGYRGTPTGIDIRKVLKTGITPIINTGVAHREPGVGQIGAGILRLPMELFTKAKKEFEEKYGVRL